MRALVIVAALASPAHADVSRRKVAEAVVKGDVATFQASSDSSVTVTALWFDSEPCKEFMSGDHTLVINKTKLPRLFKCITDLGPRVHGDPDDGHVLIGAGTSIWFHVGDGKRLAVISGLAYDAYADRDDAVPVHSEELAAKTAGFTRQVVPPGKRRDAKSQTPYARLRACVDTSGAVNSVETMHVSDADYGAHVEQVVRRWRATPFKLRGKPVRACARFTVGDPAPRDDIRGSP
jgi:hypothetical protein